MAYESQPPSYDYHPQPPSYSQELMIECEKKVKEMKENELYSKYTENVKKEYEIMMSHWRSYIQNGINQHLLKTVEDFYEKEKILYFIRLINYDQKYQLYGAITSHGLYFFVGLYSKSYFSPIYMFDKNLDKRDLTIIDQYLQLHKQFMYSNPYNPGGIQLFFEHDDMYRDVKFVLGSKKFESIIRLIPGSYKNGKWKQLDGFFGMYFNEETLEISNTPPPL